MSRSRLRHGNLSTAKNIQYLQMYFLMNRVTFLDLRVYFSFPTKCNRTLQVENKHALLERKKCLENYVMS